MINGPSSEIDREFSGDAHDLTRCRSEEQRLKLFLVKNLEC